MLAAPAVHAAAAAALMPAPGLIAVVMPLHACHADRSTQQPPGRLPAVWQPLLTQLPACSAIHQGCCCCR